MNISIVGGGWVGCHLASKLMHQHDVTLYEENDELFLETSHRNQNRLHLGYHYARNYDTRKLCVDSYDWFMKDYGNYTEPVAKNYYCIPNESIIDFRTYLQIFNEDPNKKFEQLSYLKNIEGSLETKERYINFKGLQKYFNEKLKCITIKRKVSDTSELKSDLIINCTNNHLHPLNNSYYELTITLLYRKVKPIQFGALTLVDGNFFSIYPYADDLFTLTDVEHTPIQQFKTLNELKNYKVSEETVTKKRESIEKRVTKYYPEFLNNFNYDGFFTSTKVKQISYSANRYPIIQRNDNLVTCYTGKIQGIYPIHEYIIKCLEKN